MFGTRIVTKNMFSVLSLQGTVLISQGVTKRCRLSWLTNSAFVYQPKCEGRGELRGLSQ
jgi:hypothetical protein